MGVVDIPPGSGQILNFLPKKCVFLTPILPPRVQKKCITTEVRDADPRGSYTTLGYFSPADDE